MRSESLTRCEPSRMRKRNWLCFVLVPSLISCAAVPRVVPTECPKAPDYQPITLPRVDYYPKRMRAILEPSTPAPTSTPSP